jgi:hypothetical protein
VRDGADHFGAGDEHVGSAAHHHVEVCDGRAVDRAARARPHDATDLRDDAGGQRVAQEDVGVAAEADDALLYARAARIVEADDGRADLHRQVHHLANFFGVRLRERPAEDGEVLREDEDAAAVDEAVAGDDAVARKPLLVEAEIRRAVDDELVELLERPLVQQELDALARRQLTRRVLLLDAPRAPARRGAFFALPQPPQLRLRLLGLLF